MTNNTDWLDLKRETGFFCGHSRYFDEDAKEKGFIEIWDKIEKYISNNFVTKEECEKRVLEARIDGLSSALGFTAFFSGNELRELIWGDMLRDKQKLEQQLMELSDDKTD